MNRTRVNHPMGAKSTDSLSSATVTTTPVESTRLYDMLRQLYFNFAYNPVYDFTTAQVSLYQRLQQACISKFEFEDNDLVLCVGIGTGNEILPILKRNGNINIVGVDASENALRRAYKKALQQDKEIKVFKMDAKRLDFDNETFNKVSCLHVMDFLTDSKVATEEIIRVLRSGGQFVITYPSGHLGLKLVRGIKQNICHNLRSRRCQEAIHEFLSAIGAGIVYFPLSFWGKPQHGSYSPESVKKMFAELRVRDYQIEEDSLYQDMIVYGRK
jgi:ubiquinone/menaquinone biosynthesis C-methylase UbiE